MYETLSKIVAGIPTAVVKGLILPALFSLAFIAWQQNTRITTIEQARAVDTAQMGMLIKAVEEQTAEIRRYREALIENARQTEAWVQAERRRRQ